MKFRNGPFIICLSRPSIITMSGFCFRFLMQRWFANLVAFRMFILSTQICDTNVMEKSIEFSMIIGKSSSLFFSVRTLLSFNPGILTLSFRITAAETTGPASGPLPASSIPAMKTKPFLLSWASTGMKTVMARNLCYSFSASSSGLSSSLAFSSASGSSAGASSVFGASSLLSAGCSASVGTPSSSSDSSASFSASS